MNNQVFNRHLHKKWNDQENLIMSKKLQSVKPVIKNVCPESFAYSKNLKKSKKHEDNCKLS
jgi:hypothetical protein